MVREADTDAPAKAGVFITFEGIDGCGKSTQLRLLASALRLRGLEIITTREPGGSGIGRHLREILQNSQEYIDPLAELLLFAADRAQHLNTLVRPAVKAGNIVLCDRHLDSSLAFQGARDIPRRDILSAIELATAGHRPDLTLLFDLPVEDAEARTTGRGETASRFERESRLYMERVRNIFLEIQLEEPERVKLVRAARTTEEIHQDVLKIVESYVRDFPQVRR